MRMQITPSGLICVDVLIHPFMTDLHFMLLFEALRYLLWTPILAELLLHQRPLRCGDTTLGLLLATGHRLFMRHRWTLAGSTPITAHLAADRHLAGAHILSDIALGMPGFLKRRNLVSLCSGELRVRMYRCFSRLAGQKGSP